MLLKETCCPTKGHLMVFQTHSITLMYCRSKDKTTTSADEGKKNCAEKILDFLYEISIWVLTARMIIVLQTIKRHLSKNQSTFIVHLSAYIYFPQSH